MSLVLIRTALQNKLQEMSTSLPTAWENSKLVPNDNKPWQAVHLLPAESENPSICTGTGFLVFEQGIMQITLFYPLGAGPFAAETKAESIRSVFYRGLLLIAGAVVVCISKTPSIEPALYQDGWYSLPISIYYYSYVRGTT